MNVIRIGLDIAKTVFQIHGGESARQNRSQENPLARRNAPLLCQYAGQPDWH